MSTVTAKSHQNIVNGIDVDQVVSLVNHVAEDEAFGKFRFRATNQWIHGSRNQTEIKGFYAGKQENTDRPETLIVDADQPEFLAGKNTAPNSVEYYLHALTSCLTTTLSYHASVQGIALNKIKVFAEGRMNVRGYFGLSDTTNKGYESIHVHMQVDSPADIETLKSLAMLSPVYEMVSRGVPVTLDLEKV